MSERNKGRPGLKGEANPMYGKRGALSPNYGKIRIDKRLIELSKQNVYKINTQNGKNVHAVVCDETEQLYESINQAAKAMNINTATMSRAANGKHKTCKGHHWHIATDEEIVNYLKSKEKDFNKLGEDD